MKINLRSLLQAQRLAFLVRHLIRAGVLGWLVFIAFVLLLLSGVVRADYVEDQWHGTLANPNPEAVTKRVQMFEVDETTGPDTTVWRTAGGTFTSTAGGSRRVYARRSNGHGSAGGGAIFDLQWIGSLPSSGTYSVTIAPFDQPAQHSYLLYYTTGPSSEEYAIAFAQQNSTSVTIPGETTISRGALLNEWRFDMGPHSTTALDLEHTGPFFVVISDLKHFLTPDGGGAFEFQEIEEHMSTEYTVTAPETTAPDPENVVEAPNVEYTPGEEPEPAERSEVVEDLQDLDGNDEARHSDEMGIMRQIRDGVAETVKAVAGLAGGPAPDGPDNTSEFEHEEGFHERSESTAEKLDAFFEAGSDLADSLAGAVSDVSTTVPSHVPQFYISMPIPWSPGNNLVLQSNETMDFWMAIARQIMLSGIFFIGVIGTIVITRSALAG